MRELERWRVSGATQRETRLVDSLRSEALPDDHRARMAAALGVAGAASMVAATAAGGAARGSLLSSIGLLKWASILVVAVAATSAGVVGWRPGRSKPAPVDTRAPSHEEAKTAPSVPKTEPPDEATPASTSEAPAPRHSATSSQAKPSLEHEIALVERAKSALDGGRPAEALTLVATHRRAHPNGLLEPEVSVIEIEALRALGRTARARARCQSFLQKHPQAAQVERVKRLLEDIDRNL